jgi:ribonuclease T1
MGRLKPWRPLLRWGAGVAVAAAGVFAAPVAVADDASAKSVLTRETPPAARFGAEAEAVHRAIRAGGPFAYSKDGSIFFNRERSLPSAPRGWYREYTVPTPGSRDRGARRIVCGGRVATSPQACWYTSDHYATFTPIAP